MADFDIIGKYTYYKEKSVAKNCIDCMFASPTGCARPDDDYFDCTNTPGDFDWIYTYKKFNFVKIFKNL